MRFFLLILILISVAIMSIIIFSASTKRKNIYLVYEENNLDRAIKMIDKFKNDFKYLNSINLKFTPKEKYNQYQDDLEVLSKSNDYAVIIDPRNLPGRESEPVRILFTKKLFSRSTQEQYGHILHELGHYFTNHNLTKIRKYIADNDLQKIRITNADPRTLSVVQKFNNAIRYIFEIPKLVQEINAELWVYNNQRKYSESRLLGHCDKTKESLSKFQTASVSDTYLFEIPKTNFLILWKNSVLVNTNFTFSEDCLSIIDQVNDEFKRLSQDAGWDKIKIIEYQDEILNCLTYKNENILKIINLYEEILEDFILSSLQFFPVSIHSDIKQFYNL